MKRRNSETEVEGDTLKFVTLGAGNEVGRSSHVISRGGHTVMLDAGIHPAHSGLASLPFYDEYDLSTVDVLLVSHFHLDHAAALPYVMQHTNFKGRVFMTHPTKAIYRWLLNDFVRVTQVVADGSDAASGVLYTDEDLQVSFDRIETIDYHSTLEVDGIRFTAYHAGHVLGAAMFLIEIGGVKVLFTGDYSREMNRHLNQAELPTSKPDIMITESTFGTATHEPRAEKEAKLTGLIHSTLNKGGRCLLPVFALGHTQELLLILEEYWETHPQDLSNVNVYFASSLARKCMAVYQTYINMMNDNIRKQFRDKKSNPFELKHIKMIKNLERFNDLGPCVVIASPGMLQNGVSRDLLEKWAPDPKNLCLITGYSIEGTMARTLIHEPHEIPSNHNPDVKIPRRIGVEEISFAAHVDYEQNSGFIELVDPKIIILVHGEPNPMGRLKSALLSKYQHRKGTDKEVKIYNPRNCEELELQFPGVKIARVNGQLAVKPPSEGRTISGVLVQKDFQLSLMDANDLREFSSLTTTLVKERQSIYVEAGPDIILYHLRQMFGHINIDEYSGNEKEINLNIMDAIDLKIVSHQYCVIEWVGNIVNDTLADSVLAILLSVDSSPVSIKLSHTPHSHSDEHKIHEVGNNQEEEEEEENPEEVKHANSNLTARINRIEALLIAQFGDTFHQNDDKLGATITIDNHVATINYKDLSVDCKINGLKSRVAHVLARATGLAAPLTQDLDDTYNAIGLHAMKF